MSRLTRGHLQPAGPAGVGSGRTVRRPLWSPGAAVLVWPYVIVLLLVGVAPVVYALVLSMSKASGGGFAGLANFIVVIRNFWFASSFEHVGILIAVWLPVMVISVVALSLLLDATRTRVGKFAMFIYYIPGALAGMSNFILWLLLLDPITSPFKAGLKAIGVHSLAGLLASPMRVTIILSAVLFYQGVGTWCAILYGGLVNISEDVIEAASMDGCNQWKLAWYIKMPLILPWLGYMLLMNFAYAVQIFMEPEVLYLVSQGAMSPEWSPNQLSYVYAYQVGNTGAAAAISLILVAITLVIGLVIVTRSGVIERT